MTDGLCRLNTDLNHAHVRHDRAHKKAALYTAQLPSGWRYCGHWSEVLQKRGVRVPFVSDATHNAVRDVSTVVFVYSNKHAVNVMKNVKNNLFYIHKKYKNNFLYNKYILPQRSFLFTDPSFIPTPYSYPTFLLRVHTHTHTQTHTCVELLASHQAPPQVADMGMLVRYEGYRENKIPGADQN